MTFLTARRRTTPFALLAVVVATAWIPAAAPAAPTLLAPASGAVIAPTPTTTLSWQPLPEGELIDYVAINRSNVVDTAGAIAGSEMSQGVDDAAATSIVEANPMSSGTWFWQVQSLDSEGEYLYSPVWAFTVRYTMRWVGYDGPRTPPFAIVLNVPARKLDIEPHWSSNGNELLTAKVQVRRGAKLLKSFTRKVKQSGEVRERNDVFTWKYARGVIAAKQRLTISVVLSGGGVTLRRSQVVRVP